MLRTANSRLSRTGRQDAARWRPPIGEHSAVDERGYPHLGDARDGGSILEEAAQTAGELLGSTKPLSAIGQRPVDDREARIAGVDARDQVAESGKRELSKQQETSSRRTGNACSCCWQRPQASWVDGLSALGASAVCALGYSL